MVAEEIRMGMRVKVLPSGLVGEVGDIYDEPDGPRFRVYYDLDPDKYACLCGCRECCRDYGPLAYSARPEELVAV